MKAKYLFGAISISFASCAFATAPTQLSTQTINMQSQLCTITAAANDELSIQTKEVVRLLDNADAVNKKFGKFMSSRKWKEGVAVGEQMSSTEAIEFGNLQEQTSSSFLAILTESKRQRDIQVFAKMAKISAQISNDGSTLPTDTNSEEYSLGMLVISGQKAFPVSDDSHYERLMQSGNCNLENALLRSAGKAIDNKDRLTRLENFKKSSENFATKYGKPIDVSRMTSEDRVVFEAGKKTVAEIQKMLAHSKDLVLISKLEAVSKLQLEVRRRSQNEIPGNPDHISIVWEEWRKSGKITDEQNELTRLLNYLNEKIPSEFMKSAQKKS